MLFKLVFEPKIILISFNIAMLFSLVSSVHYEEVLAVCPNSYHKSPSGDCEKFTPHEGLPRCPAGYHRSPDGDCEAVSGSQSNSGTGNEENKIASSKNEYIDTLKTYNVTMLPQSQCSGSADCFEGIVTEVVDGDTIDVNNVRISLVLVNTPEVNEV